MSLYNILDIASTGIQSQSVRINLTASNLANANTPASSANEVYQAKYPVFKTILSDMSGVPGQRVSGVEVSGIAESQSEARKVYQPNNPLSDDEGYVYYPSINAVKEMADMISTSRTYQNNVEAANMAKTMIYRTLSLGQN